MNYKLRSKGEDLGTFTLEELRTRREAGQLTGSEYVQSEGSSDWQPLDLVLQHGYRQAPPPLPYSTPQSGKMPRWLWPVIICVAVLGIAVIIAFVFIVRSVQYNITTVESQIRQAQQASTDQPRPDTLRAASRPIVWTTNTLTVMDAQKTARDFRVRNWVDEFEKRRAPNPAIDQRGARFIRAWIDRNYGGPETAPQLSIQDEAEKLAGDPNCTDPLLLTVVAAVDGKSFDSINCYARALSAFPQSKHRAYPWFYAALRLADLQFDRSPQLLTSALEPLQKCFSDGSFTPDDQQEVADILINGWGYRFFQGHAPAVCSIVHNAGPDFQWLALTLDGEREISEAWAARGGGYANTVTQDGESKFESHLASADTNLTSAWRMHPDWPIAPARMIYVSLGESGIEDMRLWFDRTTAVQIDYARAWNDLRWGLRPRWYGDYTSMLALGKAAVNTGRFDTDVPRKYMDTVADLESEMALPPGQHIYSRPDVWADIQRMYEGYIDAPSQAQFRNGWRSAYAVVAYFAKHYDVSRTQLEALNWKPAPGNLRNWNVDLSLMPLEVAARTGPLGVAIAKAESARNRRGSGDALKQYSALTNAPDADKQTSDFIQRRLWDLADEQRLTLGEAISVLPSLDKDPDWVFESGKARVLQDGAVEVESGADGHLIFSRVRAGANFEITGSIDFVKSADGSFQAGVIMGMPDHSENNWYSFTLRRNKFDGDTARIDTRTHNQMIQPTGLKAEGNTFDFKFKNGSVTLFVNGSQICKDMKMRTGIAAPDNSYLIGVGADSGGAGCVVRYHDVQLKKL